MSTTTRAAYAVRTADWLAEPLTEYRESADGEVQVTRGDRTFQAERVKVRRPAEQAFTPDECARMEAGGTVIPHRTYSLQQEDFRRAGFEVVGALVQVGSVPVICIATEDRYGIFPAGTTIRRYASVEEWRASADYPAGEQR